MQSGNKFLVLLVAAVSHRYVVESGTETLLAKVVKRPPQQSLSRFSYTSSSRPGKDRIRPRGH